MTLAKLIEEQTRLEQAIKSAVADRNLSNIEDLSIALLRVKIAISAINASKPYVRSPLPLSPKER